MANFEEVAELASDINTKLGSQIQPETLVHLIQTYAADADTLFCSEVPISEITEMVHCLILQADAFLIAQDGADVETLEAEVDATAEALF